MDWLTEMGKNSLKIYHEDRDIQSQLLDFKITKDESEWKVETKEEN